MRVVGLTGGIATGKSTVSAQIKQDGTPLIDCDEIAHDVVRKGRWGYKRVVRAFGTDILTSNGEIDREALGSLVFSNPAARKKLNSATHLPVFVELFRQVLVNWLYCQSLVVVDMPLLFETGAYRLFGTNVLVTCDADTQRERLMRRDACSRKQAEAKMAAQLPLAEKRKKSQVVIDNSGTREATAEQTAEMLRKVRRTDLLHRFFLGPPTVLLLGAVIFYMLLKH